MKTIRLLFGIAVAVLMMSSCEKSTVFTEEEGWTEMKSPVFTEEEGWAAMKSPDFKPFPNLQTNYYVTGTTETGVDIVFIHGLAMSASDWTKQVEFFNDKARVININLPYVGDGYDFDLETDYTFQLLADAVHSVLHQVKSKKAIIVGHSSGFAVGKELGLRHPENVGMLINLDLNPFFYPPVGDPSREEYIYGIDSIFLPMVASPTQEFLDINLDMMCPPDITPSWIRDYVKSRMQQFPTQLGYKLFYQLTREELFLPQKWTNIPTLSIFNGPRDEMFLDLIEAVTPGMKFEFMPMPCGHYIQMEQPDMVNEMIYNFAF